MSNPDQPDDPTGKDEDHLAVAVGLIATGLRRALGRPHERNESVNPGDAVFGVDTGDQTGISADAPQPGA
jgi:hypothetical protein